MGYWGRFRLINGKKLPTTATHWNIGVGSILKKKKPRTIWEDNTWGVMQRNIGVKFVDLTSQKSYTLVRDLWRRTGSGTYRIHIVLYRMVYKYNHSIKSQKISQLCQHIRHSSGILKGGSKCLKSWWISCRNIYSVCFANF